jgi:hypothetical protein
MMDSIAADNPGQEPANGSRTDMKVRSFIKYKLLI